ncbi:MAG TPA: putative metal-dependent hydrolase, partial [Terriglobia bacterium]|nr:putative metal-dependent hydrolase [Terriglobia bacterium]
IEEVPARLRAAVKGLSDAQLDTPYREGGWTVRQVVHHLADSHMNSYVRFRLALTESEPTIKTYDQTRWAELRDARTAPVEPSLALLESLHKRWVLLLKSLEAADFSRTFRHPDRGTMTLDQNLALYAWHGRHHVAHITSLRERMGWR